MVDIQYVGVKPALLALRDRVGRNIETDDLRSGFVMDSLGRRSDSRADINDGLRGERTHQRYRLGNTVGGPGIRRVHIWMRLVPLIHWVRPVERMWSAAPRRSDEMQMSPRDCHQTPPRSPARLLVATERRG